MWKYIFFEEFFESKLDIVAIVRFDISLVKNNGFDTHDNPDGYVTIYDVGPSSWLDVLDTFSVNVDNVEYLFDTLEEVQRFGIKELFTRQADQ